MKCKYPDRDLTARLDDSICRWRGIPVYVRHSDRNQLTLYKITDLHKKVSTIQSDDDDFDISTIPLGYFQAAKDIVAYVSRKPQRRWKQGVNNDCLDWKFIKPQVMRYNIFNQSFEDMVVGIYPSLEEALQMFERSDEPMEIAIHRDVALEYLPNLKLVHVHYKGDEVGFLVLGTKTVIVPSSERAWVISQHLSGFTWEVR